MANGKDHTIASIIVGASIAVGGLVSGYNSPEAILGGLSGAIITPDLDVDNGCIAFTNVKYAFGTPASKTWRVIWYPYALLVKHRSAISHFPILSTALRLAYLYAIIAAISALSNYNPEFLFSVGAAEYSVGLALSDAVHFLMDILPFWRQR